MKNYGIEVEEYSLEYFFNLLSASINGVLLQPEKKVNWDQLGYLAKIQNLLGLLGYMAIHDTSKFKPEENMRQSFLSYYLGTLQYSIYRDSEFSLLIETLGKNQIPHILIKGFLVQNYYPMKELRTMGDIDFVVQEKDVERAINILYDLGYTLDKSVGYVNEFSKGNVKAEMHSKLFNSTYTEKNFGIIDYFQSCWENTEPLDSEFTYELKKEYHLLYLLCHMAKHFRGGGCGVRMFMDIAVFINYFKEQLDYAYLWRELDMLSLRQFAYSVFRMIQIWFGSQIPDIVPEIDDEIRDRITEFVIGKGIFGSENRTILGTDLRIEYEKNTKKNKNILKIRTLFKSAFPSNDILSEYYPSSIRGFPFSMIGWFCRTYHLIFNKRGYGIRIFNNLKLSTTEAEKTYSLFVKIGL